MSSLKPIHIYSHQGGPNPWKVVILLEELGIPYEQEFMEMSQLHQKPFEKITPNGRVPAIFDPNNDFTLWESGAILEYIQETYDKENKFGASGLDKFLVKQWLHFQVSGQGPYTGQAVWFAKNHPEKIESAVARYKKEIVRMLGVLNAGLEGKTYLVAEKHTIADLAFLPWDSFVSSILGDEYEQLDVPNKLPHYYAWRTRLFERPAVKKAFADREAAMAAQNK